MDDSELRPVGRTSYRPPTAPPAMRPRRRATSPGTGAAADGAADRAGDGAVGTTPAAGPAPDDTDVGWGERPAGDDDAQYLADRPPHWGSD